MMRSSSCAVCTMVAIIRLLEQPLANVEPHSLHCAEFDSQSVRGFFVRHSQKILQLHESAPFGPGGCELIEEPVHSDGQIQLSLAGREKVLNSLQRDELCWRPSARVIDQVPPHYSACYREEMPTVLPVAIPGSEQGKVGLTDQLCSLPGVTLALTSHQIMCEPPQMRKNFREQFVLGLAVSIAPPVQ